MTMVMNLYNYYDEPNDLDGYLKSFRSDSWFFWEAFKRDKNSLRKHELPISKNPLYSFIYARDVLEGEFKKGENSISKSPEYAFKYAMDILQGRFKKGEETILNSDYKDNYIAYLKGRGIE